MVKLGHIAIDGTKLKANASKHKAMSYERMGVAEKKLEEEVHKLLAEAARIDAEEDAEHGRGAPEDDELRVARQRYGRSAKPRRRSRRKRRRRQRRKPRSHSQSGGAGPRCGREREKKRPQGGGGGPESRIMPDGANKGSFVQASMRRSPSMGRRR